ncbi:hypothetical protein [Nonomuraea glycinis]|uniref:hypothetical protein n=1 Tax=Nonomuraea glycinis TaxID=2047744 RepID=UPI002E15403F|nr:hypothetical protein OHA68_43335 [Nonomuraea glycinis]
MASEPTEPETPDPVRRAYSEALAKKQRRILYNAGPVVALQQATAGNSRQTPETDTPVDMPPPDTA